jgi:hypothetical protein
MTHPLHVVRNLLVRRFTNSSQGFFTIPGRSFLQVSAIWSNSSRCSAFWRASSSRTRSIPNNLRATPETNG